MREIHRDFPFRRLAQNFEGKHYRCPSMLSSNIFRELNIYTLLDNFICAMRDLSQKMATATSVIETLVL
jgi:hypothetical protein